MQAGGIEHVDELILVLGRHVDDIGNTPHIGDVEQAVMGGPVIPGKPPPVHTEDHRQILQADVVDNLVVSPLQEGGVNRAKRLKAFGGHARGKEHRMLFGNTDVEIPVRVLGLESIQAGAVGHRPRDRHNPGILVRQFGKVVGKDLAERGLPKGLGFSRLRVVRSEAVKLLLFRQGGFVPLSLRGGHMENDGEVLGLKELKHLDEGGDIVAVHRTVVGHA